MGRNVCLLSELTSDKLVECIKPFRQVAALLVRQTFEQELSAAKAALDDNSKNFAKAFRSHSGLKDQYPHVMQEALNEVEDDSRTRLRLLEKALKLQYLSPSDAKLLRPSVPDFPYEIDFRKRDKHQKQRRFEAKHIKQIALLLKG